MEEAVVEVAKSVAAPMLGASIPPAKVEVAVVVATNEPAVQIPFPLQKSAEVVEKPPVKNDDGEYVCQVPAQLPPTFVKLLIPEKVLLSPRMVEEAAATVTEPPKETDEPLMVTAEFWSMALVMERAGKETEEVAVRAPTVRTPAVVEPR